MLVLVLLLDLRETVAFLLMVALVLLLELLFWGMVLRVPWKLLIWIGIFIMLTHMISWVHLLPVFSSLGFPSSCLLTLRDPRLGLVCPLMCRYEDAGWRTWAWWLLVLSMIRTWWFSTLFGWLSWAFVLLYSESFPLYTIALTCIILHVLHLFHAVNIP